MRILIVTSTFKPELSGIAEAVYKRVKILSQFKELDFLVLIPDYSPVKEYLPDYSEYVGQIFPNVLVKTYPSYKPKIKVDKKDGRIIGPFWQYSLEKGIQEFKPDLIHIDEPERLFGLQLVDGYLRRIGVGYARRNKIPVAAMWHTDYYKYSEYYASIKILLPLLKRICKIVLKWVYNSYDLTICSSKEAEKFLTSSGIKNTKYMNSVGVDLNHFKKEAKNKASDYINLMYVGRITPEKNVILLLKAFETLGKKYSNLILHIIGDGPQYDELYTMYSHYNNIKFYGKVKNVLLPEYLSEADIFINPSHTETFGLTSAEAAACSLPLIVAAGGGNLEMVKEGYNGLLFKQDDCDELIQKIEYLIENKEIREHLSENSRLIAHNFDYEKAAMNFYETWLDLYNNKKQRSKNDLIKSLP